MKRQLRSTFSFALGALALAGCSASIEQASLAPTASAPTSGLSLPKAEALLPAGEKVVGTPTELYTRIARGALNCWFGASGPLKDTYIYHADADPASKGGRSQISIHVRDKTKVSSSEQKSVRVFKVSIAPGDSKPTVDSENIKLPPPLADRLTSDVKRWAADEEGCSEAPAAANWTAGEKSHGAEKPKAAKSAPAKTTKKTAATKKKDGN